MTLKIVEVRHNEFVQEFTQKAKKEGYTEPLALVNLNTGDIIGLTLTDAQHNVFQGEDAFGREWWVERT
jgi:plastocyanin